MQSFAIIKKHTPVYTGIEKYAFEKENRPDRLDSLFHFILSIKKST